MEWDILTVLVRRARQAVEADLAEGRLSADEVLRDSVLIRKWKPGVYALGDVRTSRGQTWRCCQGHDSTGDPTWEPGAVPALWAPYHATDPALARPWVAPTGAHDAYQKGEVMVWKEGIYRAKADGMVYDPLVYPDGWEFVGHGDE